MAFVTFNSTLNETKAYPCNLVDPEKFKFKHGVQSGELMLFDLGFDEKSIRVRLAKKVRTDPKGKLCNWYVQCHRYGQILKATVEHLLKDTPEIRTPMYKGHCRWSHLRTHAYKITTELNRTPVYKGQNFIPQWCPA